MKSKGFTLIEVLIALGIFALMAVMAVTGLRSLIDAEARQKIHSDSLRQMEVSYALLERDLKQIVNRPVKKEDEIESAFIGYPIDERLQSDNREITLFTFTRTGAVNPLAELKQSALVRVEYSLRKNQLIRKTRPVNDKQEETENIPVNEQVLLDHIDSVKLAYIDDTKGYQDTWLLKFPQIQLSDATKFNNQELLPSALSMIFQQRDYGMMEWYWLLPGGRRAASV